MKNRKLIALASVAVLAVSTFARAETANVNVYGTLNLSLESVNAVDATNLNSNYVNRFRLASNASNFGIKGSEDLSETLKAFFQIESSVGFDGSGALAMRNTGIGLTGGFGTALIGVWDTPFKLANTFMEPFYGAGIGYMASMLDIIGEGSTSATFASAGVAGDAGKMSFTRRQGNSVQYWSPTIGGATLKAVYSTNLDRGMTTGNPDLLGASLGYAAGPLNAAFAYEQHDDFGGRSILPYGGAAVDTKDVGMKAAVGYKFFDSLSMGLAWSNLAYKAYSAAGTAKYDRNAYVLTAMQKMDAITFRLGLGTANQGSCENADASACASDNLGASMASIGASYSIGKRTDLYGLFSKIWNQSAATYNFALNPVGGTPVTVGADPMGAGIGVRHSF